MSNPDVRATYKGRSRRIRVEPVRAPEKTAPPKKQAADREPGVSTPRTKAGR